MLRLYIKQHYEQGSEEVLYSSLDWVYFSQHTLVEVVERFYRRGSKLLVLDEVHKYDNWSREVKEIADVPASFILADDIEHPRGNKLPLWVIGFTY